MKNTLSYFKTRYRKAKTMATKTKIFNLAMVNLPYADTQAFIKWQLQQ